MRKVVKETEEQKKKKAMKEKLLNETAENEKNKIDQDIMKLKQDEEEIEKLSKEKEKLMKKAEFKPPGIKGKVKKKIINANGEEEFIEVDLENEDFDDNASVYEEVIDEFGNKVMKKVDKQALNDIKQ